MTSTVFFCLLVAAALVKGDNLQLLATASTTFSQNLHKIIASDLSSAVFSPYSIHATMSLAWKGAKGDTAQEMKDVLGLTSLPEHTVHQTYHDLITKINELTDIKVKDAKGMFLKQSIQLDDQYVKDVKDDYLADVSKFDEAVPEGAEKVINEYVEKNTDWMVKDLLEKGSIKPETVMVLVNAIIFNGTWAKKFDPSKTKKMDFQKLDGSKTQVDMMYDEMDIKIKQNVESVDVAELPFLGDRFCLYIVLPKVVTGITDVEKTLIMPGKLDSLLEGLAPVKVGLSLPKFKIESKYSLSAALKEMGMKKAFDPTMADFKGISTAGGLYISEVIHKAMMELWVAGTVAATTAIVRVDSMAMLYYSPFMTFKADHRFKDELTGQILFQGKFSGDVYINDVVHKSILEIDEIGTMAGAATGVDMTPGDINNTPPQELKADRPFLFFLKDNETKSILLQGKFLG